MKFAILALVSIIYLVLIMLVSAVGDRAHRFRRLVLFGLLCGGLVLLFQQPLTRWTLNNFDHPVHEVVSGREFHLKAGLRLILLELDGVNLPDESQLQLLAKEALIEQIGDRKVSLELTQPDERGPGPIPVIARIGGRSLNESMVEGGFLNRAEPEPPISRPHQTEEAFEAEVASPQPPSNEPRAMWQRWLTWVVLGLVGSTGLGMIIAGNGYGWLSFLVVVFSGLWALLKSWQAGFSIWPPIVGLLLVVVLAGNGAKASRILKDRNQNI